MTTEERIDALERKLTRTRRLFAAVVAAGLGVVCMGQANDKVPDVVKAKSFVVADSRGNALIELASSEFEFNNKKHASAQISILNPNTRKPMLTASSSGITLFDANAKTRVMLQSGLGDVLGPYLWLTDKNQKARLELGLAGDGHPTVSLNDSKGVGRTVIGSLTTKNDDGSKTTYPESTLFLFGPDGKGLRKFP